MEPFGNRNPEPILRINKVLVSGVRRMGAEAQHLKLFVQDRDGKELALLAFSAPEEWFVELGDYVNIWFQPNINEWNGHRSVEGRLVHLENA